MTLNAREASMARFALREQAKSYRKMTRSRQYAGEQFAALRERARTEADAYDALADKIKGE